MTLLTFTYTARPKADHPGEFFEPIPLVDAVLRVPADVSRKFRQGARAKCRGYVDSGAPTSHIPYALAEQLHLEIDAWETKNTSIGGVKLAAVVPPGDWSVAVGPYVAPIRPIIGSYHDVILGQDFMAAFVVTFDARAQTVTLQPHDDTGIVDEHGRVLYLD